MRQSLRMSLIEAIANVASGFALAVQAQLMLFPVLGLHPTLDQSVRIGLVFTLMSILRSFALRCLFEHLRATRAAIRSARL